MRGLESRLLEGASASSSTWMVAIAQILERQIELLGSVFSDWRLLKGSNLFFQALDPFVFAHVSRRGRD